MEKPNLEEMAPEAPEQGAGEPAHVQMIDQVIQMIQSGDSEGAIAALTQMKGEEAAEPAAEPQDSKAKIGAALDKIGMVD